MDMREELAAGNASSVSRALADEISRNLARGEQTILLLNRRGYKTVGMSTACETIAARHMGIEVCGISCITNLAAGMTSQHLNHQEVQQTADRVAEQFQELLTGIITHV